MTHPLLVNAREPLCPWKIAAWPLFQLAGPLCNCHGCCLNTLQDNNAAGWTSQLQAEWLQESLTWYKSRRKKKKSEFTTRLQRTRLVFCRLFKHCDVCLCKVFFLVPSTGEERARERVGARDEMCVLAWGDHKSQWSLQQCNVSWESCVWFNSLKSGGQKKKPVRGWVSVEEFKQWSSDVKHNVAGLGLAHLHRILELLLLARGPLGEF